MGKKSKRGSSAPSAAIESEIEDILLTILDECGALGSSNHENPWDQMALAVMGLANALNKLALSEPFHAEHSSEEYHHRPSHDDNNNHHKILDVETAAQQVIRQCDSGSIEIREQANRLFMLCNEAECVFHSDGVMNNKVKLQRVRIVMRSVTCGIRQRTSLAETAVMEILSCLPHLYSAGTPQSSVVGKLRECGRLLQRRCIELECSPWMEALELVAGIRPENTTTDQLERPAFYRRAILSMDVSDPRGDSAGTQQYSEASTDKSSLTPSNTILKAIHTFLDQGPLDPTTSNVTSLLLVGPEGSGKTVLCNQIQKLVADSVQVVRPQLPVDILGLSVGETEDVLISLCAFAKSQDGGRCLLLLDDAEHIFGQEYNGPKNSGASGGGASQSSHAKETHLQARFRSTMLSLLDTMERINTDGNRVLLVCTANHNIGETLGRFDEIHYLAPPDESARKQMIRSVLESSGLFSKDSWQSQERGEMEDVLASVVDCSVGMHYAQLSLHCRQAMLFHCNDDAGALQNKIFKPIQVLNTLKQRIQTSTPSSLRSTDTGDFVDMTVLTAKDMLRPSSTLDSRSQSQGEGSLDLPLFGSSAEAAWRILHRLIVLPLCRAKALDRMLYGTSGQKAGFSSGVLLTGPPGCGKSSIAYSIAAAAASILPSIKLINVSCTSLVHKEVGRSEQSVHKLFECARAAAPCILIMDGIENIAAVRGNDYTTEGTMDRVLSTLLTELDGVDSENVSAEGDSTAIAIICITSNVNWIDPALRRPGRLEKVVELTRPEQEARRRIARKEIQQSPFLSELSDPAGISLLEDLSQFVSEQTEGMTAAGVIALCNEAKLLCAHDEAACGSPLGDGSVPRVLCRRHFLECHGAR